MTKKNYGAIKRGFSADPSSNSLDIMVDGKIFTKLGGDPPDLYNASTTKEYPLGTRYETWDGRVFRYCYANGTVHPEFMAYKAKKTNTCTTAPTQATAAALIAAGYAGETLAAGAIGSSFVTVTIDTEIGILTTGVLSADEMVGGYIVIGNGALQHPQMRMITRHAALTTAGGSLTVKLDAPLVIACTASSTYIEFMESPYYCIKADGAAGGGGEYVSYIGVPASVAADTYYFWLQRRGPCWITSNSNTCNSAMDRTICVVSNGSVVSSDDVTLESGFQAVGYALDMSSNGGSNAPFVYLTLE